MLNICIVNVKFQNAIADLHHIFLYDGDEEISNINSNSNNCNNTAIICVLFCVFRLQCEDYAKTYLKTVIGLVTSNLVGLLILSCKCISKLCCMSTVLTSTGLSGGLMASVFDCKSRGQRFKFPSREGI